MAGRASQKAPPAPSKEPLDRPNPSADLTEPWLSSVPAVLTGRFAITDVSPTVESGRRPAKAVVHE